jgi:hypothetical protein
MRYTPDHLRWVALGALLLAVAPPLAASPVPSSTNQAGRHYLLWARASEARIWELDAAGGVTQERTLTWPSRPPTADVWFPRELSMGPDGGLRLLWTSPALGRSVAWHLDAGFTRTGETVFQAGNPPLNWYSTALERRADGSGRLAWFNGQVGSAVVWGLDAAGNKISTKAYTPAADPGAWVPVDFSTAPDGSARLVWTYVWNGVGPWGGRSVVWFLDGNDVKVGSQGIVYEPDWYLRTYHFGNDGQLRFLLANDLEGRGKLCTSLTDTTHVPTVEGWGPGKCKSFGPERGWILRSYTGNLPLDLSAHERAMIERESERLGYPPESFISPTQIRVDDMILSTSQIEGTGELQTLNVNRWSGGKLYLEFPWDASPTFIQNVLDACRLWADHAGVSCLSGYQQPRLHIERATGGTCNAYVGLQPGNRNFVSTGEDGLCVAHEMGHALGLIHTHQREDRDEYVTVHPENIVETYLTAYTTRYRVLPFGFGPYDFHSVMHYEAFGFLKPGVVEPSLTRLDGSTDIGGNDFPTPVDEQEMRRLYPGVGAVSPASDFAVPPEDRPTFYISSVVLDGSAFTPGFAPPLPAGSTVNTKIVLTNSGRPWTESDSLWIAVEAFGAIGIPSPLVYYVDRTVPTGGGFELEFELLVSSFSSSSLGFIDITLLDSANRTQDYDWLYLPVGSGGATSTGVAQVPLVEPGATVLPPGSLLPFDVHVRNPGSAPETVRVRGYIGGAMVTDPQASFQIRTLEPGQSERFTFAAFVPDTPGIVRAYGQLYTVNGNVAFTGNESGEVQVKVPPAACGGCSFAGVACGEEGFCLNDPSLGCGVSHVCGTTCDAQAEMHHVTVTPNPVPPGAPFTVSARVKNLSAQINQFSIRGYTDHPQATPSESWVADTSLQPLEVRDYSFVFTAPAAGAFQAHGQVFCPGAPLPFVGNSSAPVAVSGGGGGGGGPYTGAVPSATIAAVGPQPAAAGGLISLHARVHNHNSYTTTFYLRPYATAPGFVELPRRSVSIPPHSEVTELIEFPVPNQPGATLDLHFQAEYTVGQALSGASATGIPLGGPNPPPNPLPPPENICPGPNDGDTTGCPLDGSGNQSYKTCESCRAAYPEAPGCAQKYLLNWCWKPQ